jgi:hypothetical protein
MKRIRKASDKKINLALVPMTQVHSKRHFISQKQLTELQDQRDMKLMMMRRLIKKT